MRPPALPPSLPTASSGLRVRSWCFRLLPPSPTSSFLRRSCSPARGPVSAGGADSDHKSGPSKAKRLEAQDPEQALLPGLSNPVLVALPAYCREHHKDLATVENTEEVKKLPIPSGHTAWIGLYDDPASWKQMTGTLVTPRTPVENNCVSSCKMVSGWIKTVPLHMPLFVTESYCRQNYHDLATIQTSAENQAVKDLLTSSTSIVWIGLYRVSWRWSDGSPSTFRSWLTGEPGNSGGSEHCGVQYDCFWHDYPCSFKQPFVCQEVWMFIIVLTAGRTLGPGVLSEVAPSAHKEMSDVTAHRQRNALSISGATLGIKAALWFTVTGSGSL
uniref:C-type lectin domain-containing protein n=1 Tax=Knipowitschia caucasica TaxID=637954 RepID=A0AAV2LW18_KNICA